MSTSKILTTHVGSLVRPARLVPYLSAILEDRSYDEAAYEEALAMSVNEVVDRQTEIGLDIVNDGEFGKTHWYRYVIERFSGIESRQVDPNQTYFAGQDRERFREFYSEYDRGIPRPKLEWAVTAAISYCGMNRLQRDIGNLKSALHKAI